MIILRELKEKDSLYMIEWMHDKEIQKCFKKNMLDLNLEDARRFCIEGAIPDKIKQGISIHYAITDDTDEYLGTISLKNIDLINENAEFSIVVRRKMQGRGVAYEATKQLLRNAFIKYGLNRIYLNVLSDNYNAIRLYNRVGFVFEGEFKEHIKLGDIYKDWKWYAILRSDYLKRNDDKNER